MVVPIPQKSMLAPMIGAVTTIKYRKPKLNIELPVARKLASKDLLMASPKATEERPRTEEIKIMGRITHNPVVDHSAK